MSENVAPITTATEITARTPSEFCQIRRPAHRPYLHPELRRLRNSAAYREGFHSFIDTLDYLPPRMAQQQSNQQQQQQHPPSNDSKARGILPDPTLSASTTAPPLPQQQSHHHHFHNDDDDYYAGDDVDYRDDEKANVSNNPFKQGNPRHQQQQQQRQDPMVSLVATRDLAIAAITRGLAQHQRQSQSAQQRLTQKQQQLARMREKINRVERDAEQLEESVKLAQDVMQMTQQQLHVMLIDQQKLSNKNKNPQSYVATSSSNNSTTMSKNTTWFADLLGSVSRLERDFVQVLLGALMASERASDNGAISTPLNLPFDFTAEVENSAISMVTIEHGGSATPRQHDMAATTILQFLASYAPFLRYNAATNSIHAARIATAAAPNTNNAKTNKDSASAATSKPTSSSAPAIITCAIERTVFEQLRQNDDGSNGMTSKTTLVYCPDLKCEFTHKQEATRRLCGALNLILFVAERCVCESMAAFVVSRFLEAWELLDSEIFGKVAVPPPTAKPNSSGGGDSLLGDPQDNKTSSASTSSDSITRAAAVKVISDWACAIATEIVERRWHYMQQQPPSSTSSQQTNNKSDAQDANAADGDDEMLLLRTNSQRLLTEQQQQRVHIVFPNVHALFSLSQQEQGERSLQAILPHQLLIVVAAARHAIARGLAENCLAAASDSSNNNHHSSTCEGHQESVALLIMLCAQQQPDLAEFILTLLHRPGSVPLDPVSHWNILVVVLTQMLLRPKPRNGNDHDEKKADHQEHNNNSEKPSGVNAIPLANCIGIDGVVLELNANIKHLSSGSNNNNSKNDLIHRAIIAIRGIADWSDELARRFCNSAPASVASSPPSRSSTFHRAIVAVAAAAHRSLAALRGEKMILFACPDAVNGDVASAAQWMAEALARNQQQQQQQEHHNNKRRKEQAADISEATRFWWNDVNLASFSDVVENEATLAQCLLILADANDKGRAAEIVRLRLENLVRAPMRRNALLAQQLDASSSLRSLRRAFKTLAILNSNSNSNNNNTSSSATAVGVLCSEYLTQVWSWSRVQARRVAAAVTEQVRDIALSSTAASQAQFLTVADIEARSLLRAPDEWFVGARSADDLLEFTSRVRAGWFGVAR